MKHIGILAHSFEGATLCYRTICLEGVDRLGPHMHPEVTMTGVGMHLMMDAWEKGDLPTIRSMFVDDMQRLKAAGADFFVLPDNTAHIALEADGAAFPLPCLHIGEVVAGRAASNGYRKVGVLGTDWTMTGPVYRGALGRREIGFEIPDEPDREMIHRVIFEELCLGVFTDQARAAYIAVIDILASRGCDAVALVCTEIPLLITPDISPLPTLDSTRLLAKAAVEIAVGALPMPEWRGGKIDSAQA